MPSKRRWPSPLAVLFLLLWSGMMLLVAARNVVAWRDRSVIRRMLHASEAEFIVTVNGQPASSRSAVLRAIRGIHLQLAHHTHPDHEIPVVIRSNQGVLELTLARDSGLTREYWVFWTKQEGNPNRLEIGRIQTPVFDGQ